MSGVNDVINKANVIVFNTLGTVGNVCLIYMTVKSKDLHFKCGYILAILSLVNMLLLWNDLWSLYLQFANIHDNNPIFCFTYNLIYFVLQSADISLWTITGVDRLLSIYKPLWYNRLSTSLYLLLLSIPMVLVSTTLLVWGSIALPSSALPPFCWLDPLPVVTFFDLYTNCARVVTCVLYGIVYYRIRQLKVLKEDSALVKKHVALVGSLVVIVALNAVLMVLTVILRGFRKIAGLEVVATVSETLFSILVEVIWAADFYVYIWRSAQYRRAFYEVILRRKKPTSTSVTVFPVIRSTQTRHSH